MLKYLTETEKEKEKIDVTAYLIESLLSLENEFHMNYIDRKYRKTDDLTINSLIRQLSMAINSIHMFNWIFNEESNNVFNYSKNFVPIESFIELTNNYLEYTPGVTRSQSATFSFSQID